MGSLHQTVASSTPGAELASLALILERLEGCQLLHALSLGVLHTPVDITQLRCGALQGSEVTVPASLNALRCVMQAGLVLASTARSDRQVTEVLSESLAQNLLCTDAASLLEKLAALLHLKQDMGAGLADTLQDCMHRLQVADVKYWQLQLNVACK